MKYLPIFILNLIIALIGHSQVVQKFDVFYKVNQDGINWNSEHTIDSAFKKLLSPRSLYYVDISGYSDSIGSKESNLKLSEERAKNIALYYEKYNFKHDRIKYRGLGNSESLKTNDKKVNVNYRKAHIEISLRLPQITFLCDSLRNFEQFKIESDFGGNIITKSQTKLFIPCDAFVDGSDKEVNGTITIQYREFRDTFEFLSRGVPMNNDREGLAYNSTGMFELKAFAGKTPVYLKLGSQISVLFGLNKRLPLLDLYFENDSSREWNFQKYLTDGEGKVNEFRNSNNGCGGCGNCGDYCSSLDRCNGLIFIVDYGLKYANSDVSISEEIKKMDAGQMEIIDPLEKKRDSLIHEIRNVYSKMKYDSLELKKVDSLIYKIERVKLSGRRSVFHLRSDALAYNEILSLNQVDFQIKEKVPDSLFKVEWDYCKLSKGKGNKFNIRLSVKGNKENLQDLKIKIVKDETKKVEIKKVYSEYKKSFKARENRVVEIHDTLKKMQIEYDTLKSKLNKVEIKLGVEKSKLEIRNFKDFDCFWNLSRQYMTKDEINCSLESWIEYFDSRKDMMKKRYEKIKQDSKRVYERCEEIIIERKKWMNSIYHLTACLVPNKIDTTIPKRDTIIIPLTITKLGLYNTAQPIDYAYTLKKTFPIDIEYYIYKKDTINISLVYLIDKKYNSFIEFNGLNKYSPYLLPWRFSLDQIRLIAFDEKGIPYTYIPIDDIGISKKWTSKTMQLVPIKNIKDLMPLFKDHY